LTQRVVGYLMVAGIAITLIIGFWPVHVAVYGNPSYDCGSGFVHSRQHWRNDSLASLNSRTANDAATGTPREVCPPAIYDRRDLALLIGGTTLVAGVLLLALTAPREDRRDRAVLASMRLRKRRAG
jgi:hypothetical protein